MNNYKTIEQLRNILNFEYIKAQLFEQGVNRASTKTYAKADELKKWMIDFLTGLGLSKEQVEVLTSDENKDIVLKPLIEGWNAYVNKNN